MASELAVIEGGGAPARGTVNLIEVAKQAEAAKSLGATQIKSGLLPQSITKPEQAMAILLTARELGLQPMFALKNITVIQGTPAPSEQALGVLVRRAGHKMRVVESTNESCTVEGVRADDPRHPQRVTFTVEDARRAGLLGKSSWKNYTRAMLRARAKTELGRSMFEDALAGLAYSVEELGAEVNEDGELLSMPESRNPEPDGREAHTQQEEDGGPVEDAEVVEEGPASERQSGYLKGLMRDLKVNREKIEERHGPVEEWPASKVSSWIESLQERKRVKEEAPAVEETSADDEEAVPDFGDMKGAAQDVPKAVRPARKSQKDLVRQLAKDLAGVEDGSERLEERRGISIDELSFDEANELIDELSPEDG
ncbi:hypothetical protein GBA65_15090 [Rubrobacter marinus]|uniref:Uncharacterized protein n=1 Tax=Rubrobacter marinus TaxID=2653852 RepID=A0A6G8PZG6_9ACTN|nr:hypothetical protein [Rubrobacter marinus]QIN79629.1 hypothetical protein GBA65_15090 [Rubrobacter marinus]